MWVMILFDLPTETKQERKIAQRFRKDIMSYGFTMFQKSIYIRHCPSKENTEMHKSRVRGILPKNGNITVLSITDKQFSDMEMYYGRKKEIPKTGPQQLSLF